MSHFDDWAMHLDPELPDQPVADHVRPGLGRIAAALSDQTMWDEPPASLRDRILTEAMAEKPVPKPQHRAQPEPELEPELQLRPERTISPGHESPAEARARSRWFRPALAVVAAAAVAAVALVAVPQIVDRLDTNGNVTTYEVAGTELTPDASATVDVEPLAAGVSITLHITGLPPAGDGEYYAGWLNGPDGSVPIGSFHWREGGIPIELWSGVDVSRYPTLAITLQQEGEPTTSSGVAVLRGTLVE